jgi:hypothetical protein
MVLRESWLHLLEVPLLLVLLLVLFLVRALLLLLLLELAAWQPQDRHMSVHLSHKQQESYFGLWRRAVEVLELHLAPCLACLSQSWLLITALYCLLRQLATAGQPQRRIGQRAQFKKHFSCI